MPGTAPDASGWEDALLRALGAPVWPDGSLAFTLWAHSEGMPASANNWLATEKPGYGGRKINKAGVYAYPTFAIGIAATAATIKQANMAGILTAFRQRRSLASIYLAINLSPWCAGCQKHRYPIALYSYLASTLTGKVERELLGIPPRQAATTAPDLDWSATIHNSAVALNGHNKTTFDYADAIRRL